MTEEELEEQRKFDEMLAGIYDPQLLPDEVLRQYQKATGPPVSQWDKFVASMTNVNDPPDGLSRFARPVPPSVFTPNTTPFPGSAPVREPTHWQLAGNFDQNAYLSGVGDLLERNALAAHWKTITTMAPRPQFRPFHQTSFASVPFQFKLGPTAAGKQKSGGLYSF